MSSVCNNTFAVKDGSVFSGCGWTFCPFYGGINVTFMPLLFTPVVCENVSCGDLSRHLPGGRFTPRTGALASAAAAGEDLVFRHLLSDSDYRIVSR